MTLDLEELERLLADEREASRARHTAGDPVRRKAWKETWQGRRQDLFRALRNAAPELLALARRGQASGLGGDSPDGPFSLDAQIEQFRRENPPDDPRGAPPTAPASPSEDELAALAIEWERRSEDLHDEQPHTSQDYMRCAKELRALLARRRAP